MEILVKNLFVSDDESKNLVKSDIAHNEPMNRAPMNNTPMNNTPMNNAPINNAPMNNTSVQSLNDRMIEEIGLATAYIPVQNWEIPMSPTDSLSCGTVFGDLVMPYVRGSSLELNRMEVCTNES